MKKINTHRRRTNRVVAICILMTFIGMNFILHTDISINSSIENTHEQDAKTSLHNEEHFTLCNKEVYIKDMPSLSLDNTTTYGIYNWTRSMENGIVIENRTEHKYIYGRTGNQIKSLMHAFDLARDNGGALVLHSHGYPMDLVLRAESISMQGYKGSTQWGEGLFLGLTESELEKRLGITFYNNVDEKYRSGLKVMKQEDLFYYKSNDARYSMFDAIEHRHYMIRELYRMTAKEMERDADSKSATKMCLSLRALFGRQGDEPMNQLLQEMGMNPVTQKYTVIHSRHLEGNAKSWLRAAHTKFGVDSRASIEYPPDMVSQILSSIDMLNSSILMITDGQDPAISIRLSSDPIIGKQFQVVPENISTVTGDLLLAILR